jgi:hypothetical protein
MYIRSLPKAWAGIARAAKAQSSAMRDRGFGKRKTQLRRDHAGASASVGTGPEGVNL